ncbi:MAG: hypothetical protein KatS3mg087_1765 [Patescibacteria group bacterium]|nr:MAG: hypothetical protein KatS3mg087_1765 [Patescibacteria group bacterium]
MRDTSQAVIYKVDFVQNQQQQVQAQLTDITQQTDYNTIKNSSTQIIKQARSIPIFGFNQRTRTITVSHKVDITNDHIGKQPRGVPIQSPDYKTNPLPVYTKKQSPIL